MIFAAPWVWLALPALPLLWWLLRVTPPAPRSETFPAIRLLMGLHAREETPARTPWWLLLLRMVAATLVILALARPVLDAGSSLPGSGPVLMVVDNGWVCCGAVVACAAALCAVRLVKPTPPASAVARARAARAGVRVFIGILLVAGGP